MFDWIRKLKKKKKSNQVKKSVDLSKRWRYAPDGVTKINVDD